MHNKDVMMRETACMNDINIADILIAHGADCNIALYDAGSCANEDVMHFITNHPQLVGKLTHDGFKNGLVGACDGGCLELVKLMISCGAKPSCAGLVGACKNGHISIVKYLITLGVTNANDGLIAACVYNQLKIVKLLMRRCLSTISNDGISQGFEMACIGGHVDIVRFMMDYAINSRAGFYKACEMGKIAVVKLIVQHGHADLEMGLRAVCTSIYQDFDLARYLVEQGATNFDECFQFAQAHHNSFMEQFLAGEIARRDGTKS
jgi:hypothetical protein